MKKYIGVGAAALIALALSGCSETYRARVERQFTDKPSTIKCLHFGEVLYEGRTKGKVEADENGRITFVEAATGRLVAVEGECVVIYDN